MSATQVTSAPYGPLDTHCAFNEKEEITIAIKRKNPFIFDGKNKQILEKNLVVSMALYLVTVRKFDGEGNNLIFHIIYRLYLCK